MVMKSVETLTAELRQKAARVEIKNLCGMAKIKWKNIREESFALANRNLPG